jgi:predicted KAP-like P-loop ATPase
MKIERDRSADNPVRSPEDDEFNRWPFSKRLADTIAHFDARDGAAVIGIFGRWGYGKSTVLNFIHAALTQEHSDKVDIFEFNPWMFKDQDALVQAFFSGLADTLDRSLVGTGHKVGEMLEFGSALLGLVPFAGTAAGKFAEKVGARLAHQSLDEQRQKIFSIMRDSSRKVVVFIDDLDRLEKDEIFLILKLVRLAANFPRIVYLLAFDDEMVARAAGDRYGGGNEAGRQFLEKVVQYPFSLPAVGVRRLIEFVERRAIEACDKAEVGLSELGWQRFRDLAERLMTLLPVRSTCCS